MNYRRNDCFAYLNPPIYMLHYKSRFISFYQDYLTSSRETMVMGQLGKTRRVLDILLGHLQSRKSFISFWLALKIDHVDSLL